MYVATIIVFIVPWSILVAAWARSIQTDPEIQGHDWRWYCMRAALMVGTIAASAAAAFMFSWSHSGGSPHGMSPAPGSWIWLRPIAECSIVATLILAAIGKGRGRILLATSAISTILAGFILSVLEMA
jgi:hypothetical protein